MDWLILRDVLNTACNITNATNKGVEMGRVGRLTMSSDTGDKVVCTMGHTDGHSKPDHTTRRAGTVWDHRLPY